MWSGTKPLRKFCSCLIEGVCRCVGRVVSGQEIEVLVATPKLTARERA